MPPPPTSGAWEAPGAGDSDGAADAEPGAADAEPGAAEAGASDGATEPAGEGEPGAADAGGDAVAVDPPQAARPIHRAPSRNRRPETGRSVDMAQVYRSNMNLT